MKLGLVTAIAIIGLFVLSLIITQMPAGDNSVRFGILTLLPPLVAIALAFITKETVLSLFVGVFVGEFMLCVNDVNIISTAINAFLGILAGIITSGSIIIVFIQKSLKKLIKNELEHISTQIKNLDVSQCKNFLVGFLADVEQGNELDKVELERAYEIYDHYINDLKQNSYIHNRWVQLMENMKGK